MNPLRALCTDVVIIDCVTNAETFIKGDANNVVVQDSVHRGRRLNRSTRKDS